jgi:hypothetical protein
MTEPYVEMKPEYRNKTVIADFLHNQPDAPIIQILFCYEGRHRKFAEKSGQAGGVGG